MLVICINGSINSGKSTVGRALAEQLGVRFIEGDDHDGHDLPFDKMIVHAIGWLARVILGSSDDLLVIAYPLRNEDFEVLSGAAQSRGGAFEVVTLAPPQEVALQQRGERVLEEWERRRISEMYEEGYPSRAFSSLVIEGTPTVAETVALIVDWLASRREVVIE